MSYNPLPQTYKLGGDTDVNYLIACRKALNRSRFSGRNSTAQVELLDYPVPARSLGYT